MKLAYFFRARLTAAGLVFAASAAILAPNAARAEQAAGQAAPAPSAAAEPLRVCAAANEAPYSLRDGTGFENRIAGALAKAMERTLAFTWLEKPAIYLVRDLLEPKQCDVVMGLDTGDERVLTTKPYYRAPYVFVQRKDQPLNITTWESPDLAKAKNIGFTPGSPAETMLTKTGLFSAHVTYMRSLMDFKDRRNRYVRIEPARMVREVADGTADVAVAFAPEVARYVKANPTLKMTVIPDDNVRADGVKVPHHFDQSAGVRKDDVRLRDALNAAFLKAKPEIEAILRDEGIPLVAPGAEAQAPGKAG